MEQAIRNGEPVAATIVEPIQAEGGIVTDGHFVSSKIGHPPSPPPTPPHTHISQVTNMRHHSSSEGYNESVRRYVLWILLRCTEWQAVWQYAKSKIPYSKKCQTSILCVHIFTFTSSKFIGHAHLWLLLSVGSHHGEWLLYKDILAKNCLVRRDDIDPLL